MRWLCIHGTGSSATIFQDQLGRCCPTTKSLWEWYLKLEYVAAVIAQLQPSRHDFNFINGPHLCDPAAGLDIRYPDGPYYTWWQQATVTNIRAAYQKLHQYFMEHRHHPYDGVVCFSRGCLLIAIYIWFHQTDRPTQPLPFKAVIFVCGGPVLSVLEELGMSISDKAREWDRKTKLALREWASKEAILKWGKNRWLVPGGNGDSDLHLNPSASVDPSDVFGLDVTQIPQGLMIGIPTVHVYGALILVCPRHCNWCIYRTPLNGWHISMREGIIFHEVP